ncbi:FAD-dependent oxidoreductase [Hydrogenophaga sp.]|uniref:glycerol-3-phosphate dehydrogenase/oxidase n=1 Tax=Hydrogenophaga sp. TaxID=1904254 RepID=UPI0035ADF44A
MHRNERLDYLSRLDTVDLAVIGGGATGLGVALDAALRGLSVVLFESHDFAGGTSSRSTKLLHGGVRYLAQGHLPLVFEALAERATVMHNASHLAQPLGFVMPSYHWWQTPFYGAGLKLYDAMARRAGLGPTRWLGRERALALLPGVQPKGLLGGVEYWDGQFDDARLAIALARSAEVAGAKVMNYMEVLDRHWADGHSTLRARDRIEGREITVRARCVVNATGVWVDALRPPSGRPRPLVQPSQGVHLVVDREFLAGDHALLVPKTEDGRVLFAVPWLGKLILGTTDTPRQDLPREPLPQAQEIDFILREASRVLSRPVRREDIRSQWVGLRPLVAADPGQRTGALSREHTIVVEDGLVTVTGGKWTTYRPMAEDALNQAMEAGLLPQRLGGLTERHRLMACPTDGEPGVPLHAPPGWHLLGTDAASVRQTQGAGHLIGMGLNAAMVRHFVRAEYALTVEDVLARRWRALFLDAQQAATMAPEVADLLRREGVAQPRLDDFLALCRIYAAQA